MYNPTIKTKIRTMRKKTGYFIKRNDGYFWKEAEFITQHKDERWSKWIKDALVFKTKKEANEAICLGYLRDSIVVSFKSLTVKGKTHSI